MKSNTKMSKQIDLEKLRNEAEDMSNVSLIHAVNDLIDRIAALEKDAARLNELLNEAKNRLADVLENDDGQAWKEGRKFLEKIDTAMEASNA